MIMSDNMNAERLIDALLGLEVCDCKRMNNRMFERDNCATPMREPDGIDIHLDRPRPEMFRSYGRFADAMGKYRAIERLAHEADWPCREPMQTCAEPRFRRDWEMGDIWF